MPEVDLNKDDQALLTALSKEAGQIALSWFGKDPEVWWKEGDSPVSQADYAVDEFLKRELLKARPDYGWLSEETDDNPERLKAKRTFVVDPIDGTRGFINGMKRWCVSIAIVENNRPVVGVLDCPVLELNVEAIAGGGVRVNGQQVQARIPGDPIHMTGPRAFINSVSDGLGETINKTPFVPSLAWRLAMVAMGELDVALARASAQDWDLAAADLIVHEAGGRLSDLEGGLLSYNCPSTRHGTLVASHTSRHEEMLDLARDAINKKAD